VSSANGQRYAEGDIFTVWRDQTEEYVEEEGRVAARRTTTERRPRTPTAAEGREAAGSLLFDGITALGIAVLGLIGFYVSFSTVRDSAVGQSFGSKAWALPLTVDAGIAVFTALDLRMAAHGMRARWVRVFPWALNGITVYLNGAEQATWAGKIGHAALPFMWIGAVEAVALIVKRRTQGPKPEVDQIPRARWLLAPGPTLLLWRRMRLWGVTSYDEALERECDRRLVRARLAQQHGSLRKLPAETRELYRMGKLRATDVVLEVPAVVTVDPPAAPAAPEAPVAAPTLVAVPALPPADEARREDVETAARRIVRDQFDGKCPGRPTLTAALKADGHTISNADAADLVRRLKAEGNDSA
jgi:hypothetical protein